MAFWRPDGVMQLVTTDARGVDPAIPRYVVERSLEGEWTDTFSGFGKTAALRVTTPQWGAQIAWSVLTDMRGNLELLTYGENGYKFLPVTGFDYPLDLKNFDEENEDPFIRQAWSTGDSFHALPYWLYDHEEHTEYSYRASDYLGNRNEITYLRLNEASAFQAFGGVNHVREEVGQLIWLDPNTGQCSFIGVECNLTSKRRQVYMLTTLGTGKSVYDPLTWE